MARTAVAPTCRGVRDAAGCGTRDLAGRERIPGRWIGGADYFGELEHRHSELAEAADHLHAGHLGHLVVLITGAFHRLGRNEQTGLW